MLVTRVKKAYFVWKNEGTDMFLHKVKMKLDMKNIFRKSMYRKWIDVNESDIMMVTELEYNPLFSVVIPVYNVADNMLRECIDSVLAQTYKNFEIILVDDASTQASVRKVLSEYEGRDGITIIYRKENGHISRATNDGIFAAKGEFVALCDCDDLYAPNALYEIAKKLNEDKTLDFIYTDEDKIDEKGKVRENPFFKPDWSPDSFMSFMYTCHLSVYRRTLLEELSGIRVGFEGSQDYDLVLRVMEKTNRIGHIPKILYHWRMRQESTANAMSAKPYVLEAAEKAKKEALERRGLKGEVTFLPAVSQHRVTYFPQGNPLVSIVIPSKDNPKILKMCLESILKYTEYPNYEIVVVDNGSKEENKREIEAFIEGHAGGDKIKYHYQPMEFNFSRMCNIGATEAEGEFLLFLNDDIEVSEDAQKQDTHDKAKLGQWLSVLLGQAQLSHTGAVSCKLYYPNGNVIQHVGVINLPIGAAHALYGGSDVFNYYYGRNILDYNYCCVTGACLMLDRKKFEEAGGFDESFPVAYNDVSLCFRLVELGYYNTVRNDVVLVHHESVSRGLDCASEEKDARRAKEMQRLYEKHPLFAGGYDPCYNPNLVADKVDFTIDMKSASAHRKVKKLTGEQFTFWRKVEKTQNILQYHVDFVEEKGRYVQINGWLFSGEKKNNNRNKTKILLISEKQEVYVVDTTKIYRQDLVDAQSGNKEIKNIALAGFETIFAKEELAKGTYDIALELDGTYVMCREQIVI